VPVAEVSLEGAAGEVLATGEAAERAIEHALLCGTVLSAAEMLGGAQSCLDGAVAYAKQREQFGRVIGSFQAIKHLCAQMLVELELTRSAVMYAVWALATADPSLPRAASTAKALANESYQFLADAALHIHGGMGFTYEHDSHLYLRRAVTSAAGFGDTTAHRELFLAHSGYPSKGES
jgi:alkylation response protein AidB-like acyl-CoA dehydrogenase